MIRMTRVVALAVLLAACATVDLPGTYQGVLPEVSGGGQRHVRVTLNADGFAAVSSAFTDRPSRFLAEGTWQRDGGRVTLVVGPRSERLVFQHSGDLLFAREWDRGTWGETGPGTLQRVR